MGGVEGCIPGQPFKKAGQWLERYASAGGEGIAVHRSALQLKPPFLVNSYTPMIHTSFLSPCPHPITKKKTFVKNWETPTIASCPSPIRSTLLIDVCKFSWWGVRDKQAVWQK
uniref:Uncharacterized protein n=1 Tax=Eutreptiella gymnastica TaxID=73025 RepID=A0A6U8CW69_9EUGL